MRRLDRYLTLAILRGTLLAGLVLLGLVMLFAFVDQLGEVGKGDFGFGHALLSAGLLLPGRFYAILPAAALLGCLLGLGGLAVAHELVAMRSAGLSLWRLAGGVLISGLLLAVVLLVTGEWLAPAGERKAQALHTTAVNARLGTQTASGFWTRHENSFVNVANVLPGGVLQDVTLYEFDDQRRLQVASVAEQAVFENGQWQLQAVRETRFEEQGTRVRELAARPWESGLQPGLLSAMQVQPDQLSLGGMRDYVGYLEDNALDADSWRFAFWMRLAAPFNLLVLVLLAIPFVLGPLRNSATGNRIMVGALVGVGFTLVGELASHTGLVYGVHPAVAAFGPGMILLFLTLWAMRRI